MFDLIPSVLNILRFSCDELIIEGLAWHRLKFIHIILGNQLIGIWSPGLQIFHQVFPDSNWHGRWTMLVQKRFEKTNDIKTISIRYFGDPGVAGVLENDIKTSWGCKALSQKKTELPRPKNSKNPTTSGAPSARLGWGMAPSVVWPVCLQNSSKAAKWTANAVCVGTSLGSNEVIEYILKKTYNPWKIHYNMFLGIFCNTIWHEFNSNICLGYY